MTRSTHSIQLSTGVRLPYVEQGNPSGVPMVLLHGYSDSSRSFELLLPHLPDSIHAYALTQRGHGDADKPVSGYRPEDYAADVAAFLDAKGVEAALIVGHSGGAYAAQRFALDHADRTLGTVLIGSFHAFHGNPGVRELQEAVAELTDPVDREFVREFQESCVAQRSRGASWRRSSTAAPRCPRASGGPTSRTSSRPTSRRRGARSPRRH
jgi:non-heme chloroperoxidase